MEATPWTLSSAVACGSASLSVQVWVRTKLVCRYRSDSLSAHTISNHCFRVGGGKA